MEICYRCDKDKKINYIWYDTGLEYQATKNHINYLEQKYEIQIQRVKAQKAIPTCCKQYGVPFLSKQVSEYMSRLQSHNFQWEDEDAETLNKKYPKCKSALDWWCGTKKSKQFSIQQNKWLKEFIIQNPPTFKISNKCCHYAKKKNAHDFCKSEKIDLNITGIRKAEGGIRSSRYSSCYYSHDESFDLYMPIFWYKNADKDEFDEYYGVEHSKCYTEYGMARTGCAGCPYGRNFEFELEVIQKHEPKLYKAVINIFGESYEYTRKYREFQKMMNLKEKNGEKT